MVSYFDRFAYSSTQKTLFKASKQQEIQDPIVIVWVMEFNPLKHKLEALLPDVHQIDRPGWDIYVEYLNKYKKSWIRFVRDPLRPAANTKFAEQVQMMETNFNNSKLYYYTEAVVDFQATQHIQNVLFCLETPTKTSVYAWRYGLFQVQPVSYSFAQ